MKFNLVLLTSILLSIQAKSRPEKPEKCYTKVDCKVKNFEIEAKASGKDKNCSTIIDFKIFTKCQLISYGLNKDQAELAWKMFISTNKCKQPVHKELEFCIEQCYNLKEGKDKCLERCTLPKKIKVEECLDRLANKSTSNAAKNAKCMTECDRDTYPEIFDCRYNCHKDVIDAIVAREFDIIISDNRTIYENFGESNTTSNNRTISDNSSSGSEASSSNSSDPIQFNSIINIQSKLHAAITLSILTILSLL